VNALARNNALSVFEARSPINKEPAMLNTADRNLNDGFDFLLGRDRLQRETLAQARANGRLLWALFLLIVPALCIVYVAAGVLIHGRVTKPDAIPAHDAPRATPKSNASSPPAPAKAELPQTVRPFVGPTPMASVAAPVVNEADPAPKVPAVTPVPRPPVIEPDPRPVVIKPDVRPAITPPQKLVSPKEATKVPPPPVGPTASNQPIVPARIMPPPVIRVSNRPVQMQPIVYYCSTPCFLYQPCRCSVIYVRCCRCR
jgi:hypothetical protein